MQVGSIDSADDDFQDYKDIDRNDIVDWHSTLLSRCHSLGGQCDEDGKFLPIQCEENTCWCVDEAGNQMPNTNTFQKGKKNCGKQSRISSKMSM